MLAKDLPNKQQHNMNNTAHNTHNINVTGVLLTKN